MIKKNISVTNQQNDWIKSQIATGHYSNESEVVRQLIRERQMCEQETPAEIQAIRAKLIAGEKSGYTTQTAAQILAEIKDELQVDGNGGL